MYSILFYTTHMYAVVCPPPLLPPSPPLQIVDKNQMNSGVYIYIYPCFIRGA